jgi:hypothetical protein
MFVYKYTLLRLVFYQGSCFISAGIALRGHIGRLDSGIQRFTKAIAAGLAANPTP